MSPVMSKRDLKELRDFVDGVERKNHALLVAKIDAALKPKKFVRLAKARVKVKRLTKKDHTEYIREGVFARAQNLCEMCGAHATDLEHAFGRGRVQQSISNCLALCRNCHLARTNNRPSSSHWWGRYALHFERHGCVQEQRMAANNYNKHEARK